MIKCSIEHFKSMFFLHVDFLQIDFKIQSAAEFKFLFFENNRRRIGKQLIYQAAVFDPQTGEVTNRSPKNI